MDSSLQLSWNFQLDLQFFMKLNRMMRQACLSQNIDAFLGSQMFLSFERKDCRLSWFFCSSRQCKDFCSLLIFHVHSFQKEAFALKGYWNLLAFQWWSRSFWVTLRKLCWTWTLILVCQIWSCENQTQWVFCQLWRDRSSWERRKELRRSCWTNRLKINYWDW